MDDFGYTAQLREQPYDTWTAHPGLDPFGVEARECRDSADHGNSLPIAVLFDVTGPMGQVPMIMQGKLGKLHGLLKDKGYLFLIGVLTASGPMHATGEPIPRGTTAPGPTCDSCCGAAPTA